MEVWTLVFRGIAALAALIGALGIVLALLQLRFHAWLKAQEIFTERTFVEARTIVFARQEGYIGPLDDNDYIVCRRMDELAGLSPYLSKKRIVSTWYDPIGKAWLKLEKAIETERNRTGWHAKWERFEEVAQKAIARIEEKKRESR